MDERTFQIIEALYPDFTEYADNGSFFHWMNYATEIDEMINVAYIDESKLVEHLNERIGKLRASSAEHDACVDVASTLEEAQPTKYKGVFKYE